ncbi:ABC transporter permease [Nocardioides perillae]|uniref:Osmoprotectant transport system permease protein n=1 Tax=Nocardioides perillae TaxID=1119534 RepID=A0A7Y9RRD6_9ACTN|nr:osmoprotectant transport system permease protein [Nocardioides perillae]
MSVLSDALAYLLAADSWTGRGGMLQLLVQQLLLTVTALAAALAVGLPLALWLGHLGRGGFLAVNVSNVGRAVPTFALLALLVAADWPGNDTLGPYGRAGLATLIALALFALPPIITQGYTAVREVPAEVVESARGMGMSGWQVFRRIELPLAVPLVAAGVRLALVQVWATATIAALVAGPGLGRVITAGFANSDYGRGIAGALVVAAVAVVLELLSAGVQRRLDPLRGARTAPQTRATSPAAAQVATEPR